eukprot:3158206-Karenia_brevis.AAC.1
MQIQRKVSLNLGLIGYAAQPTKPKSVCTSLGSVIGLLAGEGVFGNGLLEWRTVTRENGHTNHCNGNQSHCLRQLDESNHDRANAGATCSKII